MIPAGDAVAAEVVAGDHGGSDAVPDEPVLKLSVVWERRRCDDWIFDVDNRKEADGNQQKLVTAVHTKHSASGVWQVEEKDLDVGGRYKIREKSKWGVHST